MKKKVYEAPHTASEVVELESGFMSASIFQDEDKHDEGVSIEGHEIGNSGNYFDSLDDGMNTWDE